MVIKYNNIEEPQNMVTFTDIPNILAIYEDNSGGKASVTLSFEGNLRQSVTADSQYYISILGETITNVVDAANNINKRFYISGDEDCTCMNVCRALRCCPSIAADFNVIHAGSELHIVAKTIGSKGLALANAITTNIPNDKLSIEITDGYADSVVFGGKVAVDVYSGSSVNDVQNYVTTIEKNWYGNECSFDMSPILATLSDYGKSQYYELAMQLIRADGEWQYLGYVYGNSVVGYHANQSDLFKYAEGVQMLLNTNRNQIYYTYGNMIEFSLLCGQDRFGWDVDAYVYDSAYNLIHHYSSIGRRTNPMNLIVDSNVVIDEEYFTDAFYVDISIDGGEPVRFNVIKPLKATEYYQRVYWRNEYGGISFFDFTGQKSESDSIETETYEKNLFDYHSSYKFEKKVIYSNNVEKSVSLTSHLMKEDGKWAFNSLMSSKKLWTYVNGKEYSIIPKSIEVQEEQTKNNIYTARLVYTYSDI